MTDQLKKDALKLAQNHAKAFGGKIMVVKSVTRKRPLDLSEIRRLKKDWNGRYAISLTDINPVMRHALW